MYLPLTSIQDAWGVPSLEEGNKAPARSLTTNKPSMIAVMPVQPQNTHTQTQTQMQMQRNGTPVANHLYAVPTEVEQHPNYIIEPEPTRVDVALFDRMIVSTLYGMSPQDRTMYVTEALRNNNNEALTPSVETEPVSQREYFKPQLQNTNGQIYDSTSGTSGTCVDQQLWGMLMFVMIFILVDKLIGIWKKS